MEQNTRLEAGFPPLTMFYIVCWQNTLLALATE